MKNKNHSDSCDSINKKAIYRNGKWLFAACSCLLLSASLVSAADGGCRHRPHCGWGIPPQTTVNGQNPLNKQGGAISKQHGGQNPIYLRGPHITAQGDDKVRVSGNRNITTIINDFIYWLKH